MPTTFPVSPKSLKEKSTTYLNPKAKTCLHLSNVGYQGAQFEGFPAEASYRLQKVGGMVLGMVR